MKNLEQRHAQDKTMPIRLKKLIGMILLVSLVIIYALLATTIASAYLGASSAWVHLAYFALTGLIWILPAMLVIKWMAGPRPKA